MVHRIKEYISYYLQQKETTHAILITGKWGSGKTYYWKYTLEDIVKNKGFTPVYLSLNGLKSREEILDKLALEILKNKTNGIINKRVSKAVKASLNIVSAITSTTLNIKKPTINISPTDLMSFYKFDKTVICFDDLERYTSDVSDVLGIINDFAEHKHIKVILLTNEEKLLDRNNKNFPEIKEKTFGKTLHFQTDKQIILKSVIESKYKDDIELKGFLLLNIPLICNTMEQHGNCNYRVVISLLDDFKYIVKQSIKDIEAFSIAELEILKFILALGFEIQISAIEEEKIKDLFISLPLNKDNYSYEFKRKYFIDALDTKYIFKSIINYFITGLIDIDKLNEEIALFKPINHFPNYYYLTKLGFWNLSDKDFEDKINNNLLNEIRNGEISLEYYDELFIKYIYLLNEHLLSINIDELYTIFNDGLTKLQTKERTTPIDDIFYPFTNEYKQFLETAHIKQYYEQIKNKIQETKSILQKNYLERKSRSFKNLLQTDFSKAIQSISNMPQNPLEKTSIENFSGQILFSDCTTNEIYSILVKQSNSNINTFTNKIIFKYKFPQEFYKDDVKFLKDLSSYIKTQIPEDKTKLKLSERLLLILANSIKDELP